MEELKVRHRQEAKALQGKITQKKKNATKKTRKGVNDECEILERELKEKHEVETAALNGDEDGQVADDGEEDVQKSMDNLTITPISNGGAATEGVDDDPSKSADQTEPHDEPKTRKPNRQKAKLARRAAEMAAMAEEAAREASTQRDYRAEELSAMAEHFKRYQLREIPVRSDGHCLFAAMGNQLAFHDEPGFTTGPSGPGKDDAVCFKLRGEAMDYVERNKDDFVPFLEEDIETYVARMKSTAEWGGHLEILAMAKRFGLNVNVLGKEGILTKIDGTDGGQSPKECWLGYYKHSFGLGEHYNSLRPSEKQGGSST